MYTPLTALAAAAESPPLIGGLPAAAWATVTLRAAGHTRREVSRQLGVALEVVRRWDRDARVGEWKAAVERAVLKRVAEGEFGVATMAKQAAPRAMRTLVRMAQRCEDQRVQLAANKEVLIQAGTTPPTRVEISVEERLLAQMTESELSAFVSEGKWPRRLDALMGQLLAAQGQRRGQAREIEWKRGDGEVLDVEVGEPIG